MKGKVYWRLVGALAVVGWLVCGPPVVWDYRAGHISACLMWLQLAVGVPLGSMFVAALTMWGEQHER